MVSSLGHGGPSSIIFHVKNVDSTVIAKGQAVKLDHSTAITFAPGLTSDPILAVLLVDDLDELAGEGSEAFGVLPEHIEEGQIGQAIVFGLAEIILAAATAVGDVCSVNANGIFLNAAAAANESPSAVLLETVSAADATNAIPRWAFVDFICNAGNSDVTAGDVFHGKGY